MYYAIIINKKFLFNGFQGVKGDLQVSQFTDSVQLFINSDLKQLADACKEIADWHKDINIKCETEIVSLSELAERQLAEKQNKLMDKTIKMIVACTNASGEPDLFFFKLKTNDEYIESMLAVDRARQIAEDEGYEGPYVVYDETDRAGKAMLDKFVWESATVYEQFP